MKTNAKKSSGAAAKAAQQAGNQPFFTKAGSAGYFAPANEARTPAVQMKMTVNKPGDKFEQEADNMAAKIMRMPTPEQKIQKAEASEQKIQKQEHKLQKAEAQEEKIQKQPEQKLQKQAAPEERLQKAGMPEEKLQKQQAEDKIQKADMPEDKLQKAEAPEQKIQKAEQSEDKLQKAEDAEQRIQKQQDEKIQKAEAPERQLQKQEEDKLQRKGDAAPSVGANLQSAINSKTTGGQTLGSEVRGFMEPRIGADFSNIRVHTDKEAGSISNQLSARAFTYKNHIFFGRDQYQPGTGEGKQLLAHELTHTVQQGAALQRSPQVSTTTSTPAIQRLGISDALDYFADKAYYIPGFRMLTILLGFNPINMRSTDRSAANILRALIEFIPGGPLITQALDNHGVFSKAAAWVEQQIATLGDIGSEIVDGLKAFLDSLSWRDIFDLGGVWDRAKRIFTTPIGRLIAFAKGVVTDILKMVKDAILRPLAALAKGTSGYDLLCAMLEQDLITGDPVPRNADTLIGGFMKLIGQQEIWENLKKGNAVARAWAWFQGALLSLMGMARAIPGKIIDTLKSLTFEDIITVAGAFSKIGSAFLNIAGQFFSWGFNQVLGLLEILFSVVAPAVMPYLKKAKGAFSSILKNPIGFIGNLVKAGKMGFQMFSARILTHLKTALIKWIVGPLADAGVYIPQSFSLIEIVKLVLSVLGLTWQAIRVKLVKIIPEPVLTALEKTAGILVTLVKEGPVAAWQQIKAELSELKDQLIAQVTQMISTEIVKAAVFKLVSMLNPAGAVIQAIIAIYNTITFFVQKLRQIGAVVGAFINSIAAIAAGQIAGAAKRVEQTMANTLTLVLAFLAKFAGLGNVPEKIVGIVKRIRQPIDKGLDKIVAWLGNLLKKAVSALKAGAKRLLSWWTKKVPVSGGGEQHTLTFQGSGKNGKLVLRSAPEKPSVFLGNTAEEKSVEQKKRKAPIATAVGHENEVEKILVDLRKIDEDSGPAASGKNADKADKLSSQLDGKLSVLGQHIGKTLNDWGVADAIITGISLPRGSFTVEHKRGIAAQHKDKSQLVKSKSKASKGELINVAAGFDRRHVVSSHDMAQHYSSVLNGKKASKGKLLLEQRGSIADSHTPVDELNVTGIQKAAKSRYSNFFGYLRNLFIGDSSENRSIQQHLDEGHPDLAGKKLENHVRHVKRAWAIDDSISISRLD